MNPAVEVISGRKGKFNHHDATAGKCLSKRGRSESSSVVAVECDDHRAASEVGHESVGE
jgi:hypothetical protein